MDTINIPNSILNKLNYKLHNKPNHPLCIIKNILYDYFKTINQDIQIFDNIDPIVSVEDNFDNLLIPKDHPSRSKSDTYYINEDQVLRTHTTAHQNQFIQKNIENFIVTGDVYRKDEIDKYHYPIFHQMEGVLKIDEENIDYVKVINNILGKLVMFIFPDCEYRINPDYFPFTQNSYEIEVFLPKQNKWLEVLGCGFIHEDIKKRINKVDSTYLAFGLGLDRLAMVLFEIPDIRYMWSDDQKFIKQFKNINDIKSILKFKPYSALNTMHKDISFYLINYVNKDKIIWNDENNFFEIIRDTCSDCIESVVLIDEYYNKKLNKMSRTYRLTFSPIESDINPAEFNHKCISLANMISNKILAICELR